MGKYINPPDCSKEGFLKQYGKEISLKDFLNFDFNDQEYTVVLLFNPNFTVAAIAYNQSELNYFKDELSHNEIRPYKLFTVKKELLVPYLE
ncbi:MAG: hypothetical protein PHP92_03255 [Candidatus Nanoarchaeia archaeon]|nr:hypothetical protein [Candidatus Nanoarchaeia archaeon]